MKKLIIFCFLIFISCNSNNKRLKNSTPDTVKDTVRVEKIIVDTVYIEKSNKNDLENNYYIIERLPERVISSNLFEDLILKNEYKIESRMNPLYLEADFNGDNIIDIALPIRQIDSSKEGFAIIHGGTNEVHIIGAGTKIKNGLSDDMNYIDIWKVNRNNVNEPGLEEDTGTGKKGELIIECPSLQIEKSEVGGGQIYWNGQEYAYFHQTC